jgi:hypothetical protein
MKPGFRIFLRLTFLGISIAVAAHTSSGLKADNGVCGGATVTLPFTDVGTSPFFCQIAGAFFSGLTNGTSATTFSPNQHVTREQTAAFVTRTLDSALKRNSRAAALNQWWTTTPRFDVNLGTTGISGSPVKVISDGADLWVTNHFNNVSRVRASDGKLLETWMAPTSTSGVLAAAGRIFLTAAENPGSLHMIDPTQPAGNVVTVAGGLGAGCRAIAFDGGRIWTANSVSGQQGSISIITPGPTLPWPATTITTGFDAPLDVLFDGVNMWVVDTGDNALKKLDSNGNVVQEVLVPFPGGSNSAAFDGTNIWVAHNPSGSSGGILVVRASTVQIVATLIDNGLNEPRSIAFDGQRMIVTNFGGNSVSLWRATDLAPLGSFSLGDGIVPVGACSDGLNFWIITNNPATLARF